MKRRKLNSKVDFSGVYNVITVSALLVISWSQTYKRIKNGHISVNFSLKISLARFSLRLTTSSMSSMDDSLFNRRHRN